MLRGDPTLDSMLAVELRDLERAARDVGETLLADTLRAAVVLAEDGDQGTLARIGGVLGAAALVLHRGGDDGFGVLRQASQAITYRLGIAPRGAVRQFAIDELVMALGKKTAALEVALAALEAETGRSASLRAALRKLERVQDERDQAVIERDVARAQLRGAELRPGLLCCYAAMADALGEHARCAHPVPSDLRPLPAGAPAPANDAETAPL